MAHTGIECPSLPESDCVFRQACIKSAVVLLGLDPAQYKSSALLYTFSKARSLALEGRVSESRSLSAFHLKSALQASGGWKMVSDEYVDGLLAIHEEYCHTLERARAHDFDMLLTNTIRLLEENPVVLTG